MTANNQKFIEYCRIGNTDEVVHMLAERSMREQNELIQYNNCAAFHEAAANGQNQIVALLFDQVIHNESKSFHEAEYFPAEEALLPIFEARKGEGFVHALLNGHLQTARMIMAEEFLYSPCVDIIYHNDELIKIVSSDAVIMSELFNRACYESLAQVKRILSFATESLQHDLINFELEHPTYLRPPFITACYGDNFDVMHFLWNELTENHKQLLIKNYFGDQLIDSAKDNDLAVIKELLTLSNDEQRKNLLAYEDYNMFVYAADRGFLSVIQYVFELLSPDQKQAALTASNFAAYRLAVNSKHYDVQQFLERQFSAEQLERAKRALNQSALG